MTAAPDITIAVRPVDLGVRATALDLLDAVLQNPASIHAAVSNRNGTGRPAGTTKDAALRRLRKEAEAGNGQAAELQADVLAGRLSAHAAMVRAGFRPRNR